VMQFDLKNGNTLWREATDLFTSDACHWSLGTYRSYLPHG
jgi:hypothetical protein